MPEPQPFETQQSETQVETGSEEGLVAEDLIEEVSIDGMCGVY